MPVINIPAAPGTALVNTPAANIPPAAPAAPAAGLAEDLSKFFPDEDKSKNWKPDDAPKEPAKEATPPVKPVEAENPKEAAPVAEKPKSLAESLLQKARPAEAKKAPDAPKEVPSEKAPEALPEDAIELNPKASDAAKEQFKNLKSITKQVREQEAKARQEAADLKAKWEAQSKIAPIATEEVERLKAEHKAALDKLAVLDLKSHPSYKQQYEQPKKALISAASELITASGIEGVDLERIVNLPRNELGKAVEEITSKLTRMDANEVESNIREAYKIAQAEKAVLSNSTAALDQIKKQNETHAFKEFDAEWDATAGNVTEFSPEVVIPPDADAEFRKTAEAHNESVKGMRQKAEQLSFGASSERKIANTSIKAVAFDHHMQHVLPAVLKEYENLNRKYATVTAELNAIKSHNPNKASFTTPGAGDAKPANPAKLSHAEAAEQYFGKGR